MVYCAKYLSDGRPCGLERGHMEGCVSHASTVAELQQRYGVKQFPDDYYTRHRATVEQRFICERLARTPREAAGVRVQQVYAGYRAYCESVGVSAAARADFRAAMRAAGYTRGREGGTGRVVWRGVRLTQLNEDMHDENE